jgi:hypothetical protein
MPTLAEISVSIYQHGDVLEFTESELFERYGPTMINDLNNALRTAAERSGLGWSVIHSAKEDKVRVRFWEKGQ